ncbi:hypothetical protein [Paraferrimonas sp. SM1919]|uniref:hypothetical protein n=1 Tax=Paraferrimonas sp. SM1919 TaxID=2662263 RepID=UPI0013D73C74|nr:hypothetical protein [Paraferrimonas sp. SM1919]
MMKSKPCYYFLLMMTLSPFKVISDGIYGTEFAGNWKNMHQDIAPSYIHISVDGSLKYYFLDDNGDSQYISCSKIKLNDLEYLSVSECYYQGKLFSNIVLSGWSTSRNDRIFGTEFVYHQENDKNVIYSIPVTLERVRNINQ